MAPNIPDLSQEENHSLSIFSWMRNINNLLGRTIKSPNMNISWINSWKLTSEVSGVVIFMSSSRWHAAASVEKFYVLCDHKGERKRAAGAAAAQPQLRHKHFPHYHHWDDNKLLRQTQPWNQRESNSFNIMVVTFSPEDFLFFLITLSQKRNYRASGN